MYIPPGFAAVTPYLSVLDAERYVAFLVHGLGGRELGRTTRPDGSIANCQVMINGTAVMVSGRAGWQRARAMRAVSVCRECG